MDWTWEKEQEPIGAEEQRAQKEEKQQAEEKRQRQRPWPPWHPSWDLEQKQQAGHCAGKAAVVVVEGAEVSLEA